MDSVERWHPWWYRWSCLLTGALENASSKDRRARRFPPPFLLWIYLKNLQRNDTAPLRPIALRRSSQWRYHQILRTGTVQISLTNSSVTRKRKVYELNVRTLENLLGTLIYLVVLSLLAVTALDTWLVSNCTRAIIWRLPDLALLLLSFWLSYLCMVLPSA